MESINADDAVSDIDDPSPSESSEADEVPNLKNGESFDSIEAFETRLHTVQDATYCSYYRRDSVTIQQCRKKGVKRFISDKLGYYSLKLCCMHGGKNFVSTGTGDRESATWQKACKASFEVKASRDGQKLVVVKTNFVHNHECTKELYVHLPQSRRLEPEDRKKVKELLHLGANKKKVKERMQVETNKVILLKDLSNIAARSGDSNNLAATVKMLEEDYGAECHVYEESNVFKGLFFVSEGMKVSMKAFPEFVGIDATFKLLNIRAPVYLMVVEDSEGCTEIVAGCILMTEDRESMTWFLECFKKAHSSWSRIKCVMADKDLLERDVIKDCFPSANVLICIFHSLRTFNREITCEKLGITPGQRDSAKETFQKMVYSRTEAEYMKLYHTLRELPKSVIEYFDKNWHVIKDEWTLTPNYMRNNFLNTTNNRIESFNGKIKNVVKRFSTLEQFVKDFFILVSCLSTERDHKAAYAYQKTAVVRFAEDSPELYYSRLLTGYSFKFVKHELNRRSNVKIDREIPSAEGVYEMYARGMKFRTTTDTCDCTSRTSMNLPCRHIFALREGLKMTLKEDSICDERWTRQYYYKHQRVFQSATLEEGETAPCTVTTAPVVSKRILSQHDKYRKAALIGKDVISLASEASGQLFVQRLEILAKLKEAWQSNSEVYLVSRDRTEQEQAGDKNPGEDPSKDSSENLCEGEYDFLEPLVFEESTESNTSEEQASTSVDALKPAKKAVSESRPGSSKEKQKKQNLSNIAMPPALKRKGRPKGAEKTTIGLPMRAKKDGSLKKLPFRQKRETEKTTIMLRWFVDNDIAEAAVAGNLIQEHHVEVRPDHVSYALIDEEVNLPLIKKYFVPDAWKIVMGVHKIKKRNEQWDCDQCKLDLDATIGDNSSLNKSTFDNKLAIRCDYCLMWYHLPCVSLQHPPKTKTWKCTKCRD